MTMLREEVTAPDAEALIKEARSLRRRRWIRGAAVALAVALVGGVAALGIGEGKPWIRGPGTAAAPNGQLLPTPGHLTSVVVTATIAVAGIETSRSKILTTLGSGPTSIEIWRYAQKFPYPGLQLSQLEVNGQSYQHLSGPSRVCTGASGTKCFTTSARWSELLVPQQYRASTAQARGLAARAYNASISPGLDPSYVYPGLRKLLVGMMVQGHASIDGVPTIHYRAMLPKQTVVAVEAAPKNLRAVLSLATDPGTSTSYFNGVATVLHPTFKAAPIDLWVDAKGVLRQVRVETPTVANAPLSSFGPQQPPNKPRIVQMSTTLTYSNLNQPVRLSVPAARDVVVRKINGGPLSITPLDQSAPPLALVEEAQGYTAKIKLGVHVSGVPVHNQFSVALHLAGTDVTAAGLMSTNACEVIGKGDGPFAITCAAAPGRYSVSLTNSFSAEVAQDGSTESLKPATCSGAPKVMMLGAKRSYGITLDCVVP